MKKHLLRLCLVIAVFGLFALSAAEAQQSAASPVTATPVGQSLENFIGTAAPPTAAPVAAKPATADNAEDNALQITDTFATGVLDTLGRMVETVKANSTTLDDDFYALPDFGAWLQLQFTDPHRQDLWNNVGGDLVVIVGVPLLGGIAVSLLTLPLRLKFWRQKPQALHQRIGVLFGLLFLRLVPGFVFLGAALLLLDQNETHRFARFVVLNIIYAIAAGYAVRQVLRCVFAPRADHLRAFTLASPQARAAFYWLSAFALIIIYGYFLVTVATALRVPANAVGLFQNIVSLVLTVMTIIVIVQTRTRVAAVIRGEILEEEHATVVQSMRLWLSQHWHRLVTIYLIIGLIITWLDIDNGITLILRGTILSLFILALGRMAFVALDGWVSPLANSASLLHRQLLAFVLRPLIWVVIIVALAAAWGMNFSGFVATASGQRLTTTFLSVIFTLFVLTAIYEMLNIWIERQLNKRDKNSKLPMASARARTLLPMMRNTIFILFCGIAVLMLLSAVGVNIGPLLAGAGVVGVAIGFGSQTLVKDFLTGLFIVIENTVAVGDVVKIGAFGGVVEAISIRTIRLRDSDGSLHILPFSEVSKISNMTKGFAYALVNIGVSYDSDLERVMDVLREIGAELQEDAVFKRVILEPIEVLGVDDLGASAITIQARIRTRPGKQWDVRRLLLLRIKQRFDKEKIEIPFPTVTNVMKPTPAQDSGA